MVDLDVEYTSGKKAFFNVLGVHCHGHGGEDVDEDIQFAWGETAFQGHGLNIMVLKQGGNSFYIDAWVDLLLVHIKLVPVENKDQR